MYDENLKPKQAGTQPLESLVQTLVKEGHFPNRLVAYADMVRELGNVGVHNFEKGVGSQDVLNSLDSLIPIVEWYFQPRKSPVTPVAVSPAAVSKDPGPVEPPPLPQASAMATAMPAAQGPAPGVVKSSDARPHAAVHIAPMCTSQDSARMLASPWKIAAAAVGIMAVGVFMYRSWAHPNRDISPESLISKNVVPGKRDELKQTPAPAATNPLTNSLGMKLTFVPAGEFWMGSPEAETDASRDEHPRHQVRIAKPFYLGTYSVTKGEFARFVAATNYQTDAEKDGAGGVGYSSDPANPLVQEPAFNWRNTGFAQTDEHPVVNVSWNDAVAFCNWLSAEEGKTYRLPTEAEWEYACRAGTATAYFFGDDPEDLAKYANLADAMFKQKFPVRRAIKASDGFVFTAPAGSFQPNPLGLYDMLGNSWQWCSDWYDRDYYHGSPTADPSGPDVGVDHVRRGGGFEERRPTVAAPIATAASPPTEPATWAFAWSASHSPWRCSRQRCSLCIQSVS